MGREISSTQAKDFDFDRFDQRIGEEMELLRARFRDGKFSSKRAIAGLELEAWLVDFANQPAPWNEQVIELAGSDDVVPELSRYNLEFNVVPQQLSGDGISLLASELRHTWQQTNAAANKLGAAVVSIGILPTVTDPMLCLANMSKLHRYRALNEQVLKLRQGRPIRLRISGRETLVAEHRDVMLEAGSTSFQLHLQVPLDEAARYYNAAVIASAASVAVASNSPLLFGKLLWDETRIPLFEQALRIGGDVLQRVTFGNGYVQESLEELFCENQTYPVLLPLVLDEPPEQVAHVRFLNGTIWRWNRPLIGFDEDGTPHLRIEHRVMSAGPTVHDMCANMALFYGLLENLANETPPPESRLSFGDARDNFYRATRYALECDLQWLNGEQVPLVRLLLDELLPRAAEGLGRLKVDGEFAKRMLTILEERIRSGQTGAVWQRRFVEQYGRDCPALTQAYRERQYEGEPVHTWTLERQRVSQAPRTPRSMLRIVEEFPPELLEVPATELAELLGGPTLIHLPGRREEPVFVSILLHGNEDVGLLALQALLGKHRDRPLPRALSIFVGNVSAARSRVRLLPDQPDYNRIWPSSDDDGTPEHAMMRHVVAEMRERRVFASIDLHTNSGLNPHYACVTRLNHGNLQLAALYGRTGVFFQRPRGVQTMAFTDLCPSVTCECGKDGDQSGVQHAAEFLEACLHLSEVPQHPLAEGDLHLFHTVAVINVQPDVRFAFADSAPEDSDLPFDLTLRRDLDHLNFQELDSGTPIGWTNSPAPRPLVVTDQSGRNVTGKYLTFDDGEVRTCKGVIPSMLTCNQAVIRQDCLGYLMERYPLPE